MLVLEIEACKPPRNDLKSGQRHRNDPSVYVRYSFVLLRPKNEVKLSTQSADKWICMGEWPVPSGGIHFHHVVVVCFVPGLF